LLQILGQILGDEGRNDVKPNNFLKNETVEHELKDLRDPNVISIALDPRLYKSRAERQPVRGKRSWRRQVGLLEKSPEVKS